MTFLKRISQNFGNLINVLVLLFLLVGLLELISPTINLNDARQNINSYIKSATGRVVQIEGDIELTISLSPKLLLKRLHIKNPVDFNDQDLLTVSEIHIEVPLLPLLQGELHLTDLTADNARLNLHKKSESRNNWTSTGKIQHAKSDTDQSHASTSDKVIDKFSLGRFRLSNVNVSYRDDTLQQVLDNNIDSLFIDLTDNERPVAEISGTTQNQPYSFKLESDATKRLLNGERWSLLAKGYIANRQTSIEANIQYKESTLVADVDFGVRNVDLGRLLDELDIIAEQQAITESINIKAKLRGKDFAELYEQAEVSLSLGDGYWDLQTTGEEKNKRLSFVSASSFTSWQKPVELRLHGKFEDKPIAIQFKSNRLQEFFDDIHKIDIDLVSSVADKEIIVKGTLDLPIKSRQFQLDISIKGNDLEKLNQLIDTEFPPFDDYSLTGKLIANEKGYILKSASVSIGDTKLLASIVIETNTPKPVWHINLNSQQLQIKDFAFDEWDTSQAATNTEETSELITYERPLLKHLRHLEDTVKSPEMHLYLNLKVDKVLSGEDHLGKAQLQLHMRDEIFSIQNADIELPGGVIRSSITLKTDNDIASGRVTLYIDKLDYGITTRLFEPDSKIDGTISTRVDLKLRGKDFTRLLENASGHIDFAVWPKNTRPTKALNLWTTNLYLILLPELKKEESLVNCIVGLMNVDDGMLKEELLAIDTTKLWIDGNINVDYKKEYIELSLFPRSKTARLFALQTPIRAQGSFSNIKLSLNPIDVTESYFSFITSPLHVPARRIFEDKIPEDGSATCEQLFDREYVEKLNVEIREQDKKEIERMLESD
jgi:uncharacterized protein involved in outer membrane biogenesis